MVHSGIAADAEWNGRGRWKCVKMVAWQCCRRVAVNELDRCDESVVEAVPGNAVGTGTLNQPLNPAVVLRDVILIYSTV